MNFCVRLDIKHISISFVIKKYNYYHNLFTLLSIAQSNSQKQTKAGLDCDSFPTK